MLASPFESQKKSQNYLNNKVDFEDADVIFVADMFSNEYTGGAELTTDNIINKRTTNNEATFRLKAKDLTIDHVQKGIEKYWVFCNYTSMNLELIPTIVANLFYSIVEYDYKFCKYRSIEKHLAAENKECDCHNEMTGKIHSAFFHGADRIFWMSLNQKKIHVDRFPFLEGGFGLFDLF